MLLTHTVPLPVSLYCDPKREFFKSQSDLSIPLILTDPLLYLQIFKLHIRETNIFILRVTLLIGLSKDAPNTKTLFLRFTKSDENRKSSQ